MAPNYLFFLNFFFKTVYTNRREDSAIGFDARGILHAEGIDSSEQRRQIRRAAGASPFSRLDLELPVGLCRGSEAWSGPSRYPKHVPSAAQPQTGRRNCQTILVQCVQNGQSTDEQAFRGDVGSGLLLMRQRAAFPVVNSV